MCYLDLEPCSVYDETKRKARKPHQCAVCLRLIYVGETYSHYFSIFEGDVQSGAICSICLDALAEFAHEHDGQSVTADSFINALEMCIDENDDDSRERWQPMLDEITFRRASRTP